MHEAEQVVIAFGRNVRYFETAIGVSRGSQIDRKNLGSSICIAEADFYAWNWLPPLCDNTRDRDALKHRQWVNFAAGREFAENAFRETRRLGCHSGGHKRFFSANDKLTVSIGLCRAFDIIRFAITSASRSRDSAHTDFSPTDRLSGCIS